MIPDPFQHISIGPRVRGDNLFLGWGQDTILFRWTRQASTRKACKVDKRPHDWMYTPGSPEPPIAVNTRHQLKTGPNLRGQVEFIQNRGRVMIYFLQTCLKSKKHRKCVVTNKMLKDLVVRYYQTRT